MKTKKAPNPMLARSPEPFEEVWMFPEGWDLSEMDGKPANPGTAEQDSLPVDQLLFFRTKLNRMTVSRTPSTLLDKIWEQHIVAQEPTAPAVLYIDLHLVHEVTSPQAFSGLRKRGGRT